MKEEKPVTGEPGSEAEAASNARLARPWQRYWARQLDLTWQSMLLGLVVAWTWPSFAFHAIFNGPAGDQLFGIALLPFALFLDAAIVAAFGNSPGKALVGLQVQNLRGSRPSFAALAGRVGRLWFSGLALGLGIIALFTMIRSHGALTRGEILAWDRQAGTRCLDIRSSTTRVVLAAVATIAMFVGAIAYAIGGSSDLPETWAASINADTPVMVDSDTRLDRATAGPGRLLTLQYTMMRVTPETHDYDELAQLLNENRGDILASTCAADGFLPFLSQRADVKYRYVDLQGNPIWEYKIDLADC